MAAILRSIEFLALSIWLGSDVFLSFVVAPGAFRVLASRDAAGAIVGYSLTRMHLGGIALGLLVLLMRWFRAARGASVIAPAALCVATMVALTAISQYAVSSRMAALRVQMGSIQATSGDSRCWQSSASCTWCRWRWRAVFCWRALLPCTSW